MRRQSVVHATILLFVVGSWANPARSDVLVFEAEDLPVREGRVENCAGVNGVRFATKAGAATAQFALARDESVEVWVRVYFRWAGDGVSVKIDDTESEVLPHRVKGKRVWNDGEHSEVWHWAKTRPRPLAKGNHTVAVSTTDSYGGWIDKIAVTYGAVPWSEPAIGGPAALLFGREPKPGNVIRSSERSVVIEAETLELVSGSLARISPPGNLAARLVGDQSYLCGLIGVESDLDCEVWCRVYYQNKNIFEAPVLQEYSQALYLTLDGAQIKTFYETDEKRWHWVSAGRRQLAKGTHAIQFHKRGEPVMIDKIVFYQGTDRWSEDWFTRRYAHVLPLGIQNSVPYDDAGRAGDWRIFGPLAEDAEGEWLGEHDGPAYLPTEVSVRGRKPGRLVLEKLRPVRSSDARAARDPEQQLSLWVRGDKSGAGLAAVLCDATGEAFRIDVASSIDWKGWRLVSASIPREAGSAIVHEGGDGVVDYPLGIGHLIITRRNRKKANLAVGEPFFESPFRLQGADLEIDDLVVEKKGRRGKTIRDESQARATARVTVTNLTDQPREAILCYRFLPHRSSHSPSRPEAPFNARSVALGAGQTVSAKLGGYQFAKATGPQALDCALGAGKPLRRLFARGEAGDAQLDALMARLEKRHGAFRFAPDGKPVLREEVSSLYGKVPGLSVVVNGVDTTSRAYADQLNVRRRLKPVGWDLSDAAGWPAIRIPAGTLAIDPTLGRYKFCEGDSEPLSIAAYHVTGFGVPGDSPPQIRGNHLFTCPGEGDLAVVDISDPPNARLVGFGLSWYFYHGLFFYRDYAYFNCSLRNTILIWDDFSNPCRVGHTRTINLDRDEYGSFVAIFEDAGVAYTNRHILDLADPFNPRPLGEHGIGDLFRAQGSRYGLSYLDKRAKIAVVDLKNPREPKLVAEFPSASPPGIPPRESGDTGKAGKVKPYGIAAVHDDYFLLRSGNRLAVYRSPGRPKFVAEIEYEGEAPIHLGGFGFYKDHLVVVDGRKRPNQNYVWTPKYPCSRLVAYRIGRSDLTKVGMYQDEVQTNYNHLAIDEKGFAYTADMNFGVWVFDLRDPTQPKKARGIPISSEIRGGWVGENYAVPAQYFGGAHVALDVRNPLNPVRKGYWWDGNYLGCWNFWQKKVTSAGDVFYSPRSAGVAIVDFSDPEHPAKVGALQDAEGKAIGSCDVFQQDGILYALSKELFIYDVQDPRKPKLLSQLKGVPGGMLGIHKGVMFARGKKICAVDVRDPRDPKIVSEIADPHTKGRGPAGALAGGYIYTIKDPTPARTLNIFDVRDPKAMRYVKTVQLLENTEAAPWGDYYFGWLESSGDYLFAANYEGGLDCYDISDREHPRFFGRLRNGMSWLSGDVKGDYLYEPTIQGLCVVDVPVSPQGPGRLKD